VFRAREKCKERTREKFVERGGEKKKQQLFLKELVVS
jgi:hypothetical protein